MWIQIHRVGESGADDHMTWRVDDESSVDEDRCGLPAGSADASPSTPEAPSAYPLIHMSVPGGVLASLPMLSPKGFLTVVSSALSTAGVGFMTSPLLLSGGSRGRRTIT